MMAAIAKFISYDGGIAFSEKTLKIQTDEAVLIPLEDVVSVRVRQPSEETEGFILVTTQDRHYRLYFDDAQLEEAKVFKRKLDTMLSGVNQVEPIRDSVPQSTGVGPARRSEIPGRKKNHLKPILLIVIVAVVIVSLINAIVDKSEPAASAQPTPTTAPQTNTPQNDDVVEIDTLCGLIEITIKDNFEHYTITHDDSIITLNVWIDGLAMESGVTKATGGDTSSWETVKNSMQGLAGSIRGLMDTCGRQDVLLSFNLLNDLNTDNILLSYANSVLFYDFMNDT